MTRDEIEIVAIAAACAASVGLLGLLVAWRWRGVSLRWLPAGVALVAVAAVIAADIGTARAMFLSSHDYSVVLWICLAAGIVSLCFAALVGLMLVRGSRQLHEGARRFGDSGTYDADVTGPAEFTALGQQLRESSRRLAEAREREQRLEESRRELVSWVSHDLRRPVRALADPRRDARAVAADGALG
jgi:signal transduction histidine kinase